MDTYFVKRLDIIIFIFFCPKRGMVQRPLVCYTDIAMTIDQLEQKNTLDVLACIEKGPPSPTRASMAKDLSLSRTTVSTIVGRLIALGLIQEEPADVRGRGRPGIPLKLRRDTWFAIGASYDAKAWRLVLKKMGAGRA